MESVRPAENSRDEDAHTTGKSDLDLSVLIGPGKLQQLLQRVYDATGFAVACMDAKGRVLWKAGETEPFCMELVRKSPLGLERCNTFASAHNKQSGENCSNVFECHAGLLDGKIPIFADGKTLGSLVTGQVLEKLPDKKQAHSYATELGIDPDVYWRQLQKVKIVTREQLEAAARLMEFMAGEIASLVSANITLQLEIDARKQAESKLIESENKFRLVIEHALDAIYLADPSGKFLMVNKQACLSTGYREEELLLMSTEDVEVGHTEEEIRAIFDDLSQGKPHRRKGYHRRKDGSIFPVEVLLCSYRYGDDTYMLGLARNISDQKKAEEEREALIGELQLALSEIKQLSGLLPICSSCKKIRDDSGYWNQLESYLQSHSDAEFSHGICPDCIAKLYGTEKWYKEQEKK